MAINLQELTDILSNLQTDSENGSALINGAPGTVTLRNGQVVKNLRQLLAEVSGAGAPMYQTVTAGAAAVAEGAYFLVVGSTPEVYGTLYRKVSGAGVSQNVSLASSSAFDSRMNLVTMLESSSSAAARSLNTAAYHNYPHFMSVGPNTVISQGPVGSLATIPADGEALVFTERRGSKVLQNYLDSWGNHWRRVVKPALGEWGVVGKATIPTSALGAAVRSFNHALGLTSGVIFVMDGTQSVNNGPNGNRTYTGVMECQNIGGRVVQHVWLDGDPTPWIRVGGATGTWTQAQIGLNGRTLVALGDSITHGVGTTNVDLTAFPSIAGRRLNARLVKLGVAGACMSPVMVTSEAHINGSFSNAVATNIAEITTADTLLVAYGTNDLNTNVPIGTPSDTSPNTFYGAMRTGYMAAIAANPSLRVVFVTPTYRTISTTNAQERVLPNSAGHTMEDYRIAIRTFAAEMNCPVVEGKAIGMNLNNVFQMTSDGLHLNDAGARRLGELTAATLQVASTISSLITPVQSSLNSEISRSTARDNELMIAVREMAILDAGVATRTDNAYSCTMSTSVQNYLQSTAPWGGGYASFIPPETNPADDPTVTFGSVTLTIRDSDGVVIPAGGLVPNRRYVGRRVGSVFRLLSGEVSASELRTMQVDTKVNTSRMGSATLTVTGVNDVVGTLQASLESWGINPANLRFVSWTQVTDNTGPVTLNIATTANPTGALTLTDARGQPLAAGALRGGTTYFAARVGAGWRLVAGGAGAAEAGGMGAPQRGEVINNFPLTQLCTVSGQRNWRGVETPGLIASATYRVSELIPVTRGQCFRYVMGSVGATGAAENMIAFYDSGSNPVGSLLYSNRLDLTADVVRSGRRRGNPRNRMKYIRIPRDGFIRVEMEVTLDAQSYLQEVTEETFFSDHRYAGPSSVLRRLNITTPILTTLGSGFTVAEATEVSNITWGGMSEPIPVNAGQFLQVQTHGGGAATASVVVFYDVDNNRHSIQGMHHNVLGNYFSNGGTLIGENIVVPVDGYARIVTNTNTNASEISDDGMFAVLTNEFFNYDRTYLSDENVIPRNNGVTLGWGEDGVRMPPNAAVDVLGPIFLKKGECARLEWTNPAGINSGGRVFRDGAAVFQAGAAMRSFRVPDQKLTTPRPHTAALSHTQWIKAEDEMAIFLTSAPETGRITIISEEELKAERNAWIAQLTPVQGAGASTLPNGANTTLMGVGFFPLLADEVLRFKSDRNVIFSHTMGYRTADNRDPLLRVPASVVATDSAAGVAAQVRYSGVKYSCWVGYDTITEDTGLIFADYPLEVYSREEYVEKGQNGQLVPGILSGVWMRATFASQNSLTTVARLTDATRKQMRPIFVPKGACVKYRVTTDAVRAYVSPWIAYNTDEAGAFAGQLLWKPVADGGGTNNLVPQGVLGYFKADRDCYLYLHSAIRNEAMVDEEFIRLYDYYNDFKVQFCSEAEYLENTTIFAGTLLRIENPTHLEFHHINNVMAYDRTSEANGGRKYVEVILQIRQHGKVLANLINREEVQGQGSAGAWNRKPNLDIKARNASGTRVRFKIGDWKETDKLTLKAYTTEKTHIRDTCGAEIWRQARRDSAYPDNFIWDPILLEQGALYPQARNMLDSVCSTRGVPCTVWAGGKLNGIYTLREKKDELNYGIITDNPDHIWLQNDWQAYGAFLRWFDPLNWQAWEVTTPEIEGYAVGDDFNTFDPVVAANIERFFNWIVECRAGTVDFVATHEDYLYLPSWIDHGLISEFIRNRDGYQNNIILTTYDSTHWAVHIYDMDWSMGVDTNGEVKVSPEGLVFMNNGNGGVWLLLHTYMKSALDARWARLRQGALREENIMKIIRDVSAQMTDSDRGLDITLWGTNEIRDDVYILDWLIQRLHWMDTHFNYSAP